MSLKEKLTSAKTEDEIKAAFESADEAELRSLRLAMGKVELDEDLLEDIGGGSGYSDVLKIYLSLLGKESNPVDMVAGLFTDKVLKK